MHIPPGFVNLTFRFLRQFDSEVMVTAIGYSWDDLGGYQAVVDGAMQAWADSDLQGITTNSTTLVAVEGAFGTIGDGDFRVESSVSSEAGTSTGDPLPNNSALLVKKLTGLGGRKNRGRNYYPDVLVSAVDGSGVIDVSSRDSYQTAWDTFIAELNGVPGLESPHLLHSDEADNPTLITAFVVQSKIATQRRRMRP